MLKENLIVKYQELAKDLGLSKFMLVCKSDSKVYYTKDGKSATETTIEDYITKGMRAKIACKALNKGAHVVAIFNNPNIQKCGNLGGIPTMLDDFTEIFGGDIKSVEKDEKKIIKELKKRRAVIVNNEYCVVKSRSLDEAGTMSRIICKSAFVMLKAQWFVTINPFVAWGMNIGYTSYYSKKNQEMVWNKENSEPIETVKIEPISFEEIESKDKKEQTLLIAKKLYQKFGFIENGEITSNEVVAILKL